MPCSISEQYNTGEDVNSGQRERRGEGWEEMFKARKLGSAYRNDLDFRVRRLVVEFKTGST
jgi:hypothetical protein